LVSLISDEDFLRLKTVLDGLTTPEVEEVADWVRPQLLRRQLERWPNYSTLSTEVQVGLLALLLKKRKIKREQTDRAKNQ
jgi:hypothetical protein